MNTTAEHVSTNFTLGPHMDYTGTSVGLMANIINLILGLPTNGYVLWLIVSGSEETLASDFFSLNVTVCEILSCMSSVLYFIWFCYPTNNSNFLILKFLSGVFYSPRPLFQCLITLQRYLAVVHPVVFLRYKPLRYKLACCCPAWMLVIVMCFLFVFLDMAIYMDIFMIFFLLLCSVMLFCCLSVLRALKRPGPGEGEREGGNNMKMRAYKIILLILITMLVTYFPFVVSISLAGYLTSAQLGIAISISVFIATLCGFIQPLLYLHRVGKLPCLNMTP